MTVRHLAGLLTAGALALGLSACGSDRDAVPAVSQTEYLPTSSPTATVSMAPPPASFTSVDGNGFTISAPPEFQRQEATSSNGEPMLVLEKPSSVAAIPQRVVVIRDVAPKQSAAEQSYALEATKAAAGPEGQAERVQLPAPEGQSAFLTTWQESRPSEGAGTTDVIYWQLMHQVDSALIINVVAFAPADEFETSDVGTILRTFEVDPGSTA